HNMGGGARLVLPIEKAGCDHVWNQYTLRVPESGRRDAVRGELAEADIGTEIYYPVPLHKQDCFAYCNPRGEAESCPVASRLASEVLNIPIYPELTKAQLAAVVEAIGKALV